MPAECGRLMVRFLGPWSKDQADVIIAILSRHKAIIIGILPNLETFQLSCPDGITPRLRAALNKTGLVEATYRVSLGLP